MRQEFEQLSFYGAYKDGNLVDPEGCSWGDDPVHYIQGYLLEFCCCARPKFNLNFIRKGLDYIDSISRDREGHDGTMETWKRFHTDWVNRGIQLFGNEEARYFFFYWADSMELTEHGGRIPGWLTEKGRDLLMDLQILHDCGELNE